MTPPPTIYILQASDASQQTDRLQKILQNLERENRIDKFTILGTEDDLSSLTDTIKEGDLILIVLTNQFESQKERIEHQLRDFQTSDPGVRIAEIIVDNVIYENEFITFPSDLRPIRNREDLDNAWDSIEQSLRKLFPKKERKIQEPVFPPPVDWVKYVKIAGGIIGVILLIFIIRDFMNSEPADPLLSDDFNDGNMNGWRVVDEGNIAAPSNWAVMRAEVQQSSNIYGPDHEAIDSRKGTFAFYNNREAFSWEDYSFSATLSSTDNDGIGLIFRYQNLDNYYKLDLDEQRRFSKLFKVINGEETTLANVTGPGYVQGVDFNLEVRVNGNQIQVFRDGTDIFDGPISDRSLSAGTVGLYCWGNANCFFDDVSVNPL